MFELFTSTNPHDHSNDEPLTYEKLKKVMDNFALQMKEPGFMPGPLSGLFGFNLIENPLLVDTKYSRRHRQKRINKKWEKKYGRKIKNVPQKDIYVMGFNIIGHPTTLRTLKRLVSKERVSDVSFSYKA